MFLLCLSSSWASKSADVCELQIEVFHDLVPWSLLMCALLSCNDLISTKPTTITIVVHDGQTKTP